jgi:DNA replication licensing factor MCM2
MHLRDVTSEDIEMAIKVMLNSFIASQKFQVKRSLEKQFQKYLNDKKDSFELLLYILDNHVNEYLNIRRVQRGSRPVVSTQPEEPVKISKVDFEQRAAELEVLNLSSFYKSAIFSQRGFSLDRSKKFIIKSYA